MKLRNPYKGDIFSENEVSSKLYAPIMSQLALNENEFAQYRAIGNQAGQFGRGREQGTDFSLSLSWRMVGSPVQVVSFSSLLPFCAIEMIQISSGNKASRHNELPCFQANLRQLLNPKTAKSVQNWKICYKLRQL